MSDITTEIQELPGAAATFSEAKQMAIFGWCLRDKTFANQLLGALKPEWFSSSHLSKLFKVTKAIWLKWARLATAEEVKADAFWEKEDVRDTNKCMEILDKSLKATERYGVDVLGSEMTEFIQGAIFQQGVQKAVDLFNNKEVDKAWSAIEETYLIKTTVSFEDGMNKGFRPDGELIIEEAGEREAQSHHIKSYGVKYLDDALGGIIPNDLIVLGASTGSGKTALAQSIGLNVAKDDPVHYFALEAENYEIQRRIKYAMISEVYYTTVPADGRKHLSYKMWRMKKGVPPVVWRIEKDLEQEFQRRVKNLHTFYRTSNTFDEKVLEQNLLHIVKESGLIIIDHLHYIDVEDKNEIVGYKSVTKTIRDIVLRHSVPIILIAHLRKKQGGPKIQALMPSIDDFHGTSDITKIATACIMLSPAFDKPSKNPMIWPTYMGVVKSRMDGSLTRYTALCEYDYTNMAYKDAYKLGKVSNMNQDWNQLARTELPEWARESGAGPTEDAVLTTSSLKKASNA